MEDEDAGAGVVCLLPDMSAGINAALCALAWRNVSDAVRKRVPGEFEGRQ
ncbi:MAG TPA: hypothetical protein VGX97_12205 [bacterium]|nr:hypothetical protein [bacterium]